MQYTIIRKPEELDWSQVPALTIDQPALNIPLGDIYAQAQLCYDEQALYVRLQAWEKHIRAEHFGPLGECCEDSCLEFFFSPIEGDARYFNIECNPNGFLYLGMGSSIQNLVRFLPENPQICPVCNRTEDGWVTEYQVPYGFIRQFFPEFAPKSGKTIRANFYKCGDLTERPHYLTWNPLPAQTHTFHCPENFGTLVFV